MGIRMDPLFVSNPSDADIAAALRLWPELSAKRVRPLLVTAFGDVYVETDAGDVFVASPIELQCERVADSVRELENLFSNPEWAEERLITTLALLASEKGKIRETHQVFAVAPHPRFSGSLRVENLVAMDLHIWHHICSQFRAQQAVQPDRA